MSVCPVCFLTHFCRTFGQSRQPEQLTANHRPKADFNWQNHRERERERERERAREREREKTDRQTDRHTHMRWNHLKCIHILFRPFENKISAFSSPTLTPFDLQHIQMNLQPQVQHHQLCGSPNEQRRVWEPLRDGHHLVGVSLKQMPREKRPHCRYYCLHLTPGVMGPGGQTTWRICAASRFSGLNAVTKVMCICEQKIGRALLTKWCSLLAETKTTCFGLS